MDEVVARAAIEPHLRAVLGGNDAEAVLLDFVQPLAARRQLIGFGWKARRDEPGREATLQHVGTNKVGRCLLQLWRQAMGLVSWSRKRIMSDEFDGLDATEKAGIGATLNRCRALAAKIGNELRNKRPEHFVDKLSLVDVHASLERAADVLSRVKQCSRRPRRRR